VHARLASVVGPSVDRSVLGQVKTRAQNAKVWPGEGSGCGLTSLINYVRRRMDR
jgi:hypothetical protein